MTSNFEIFAILDHQSLISNVRTAAKLTQKKSNKYQGPRTANCQLLFKSKITIQRMAAIETLSQETKQSEKS